MRTKRKGDLSEKVGLTIDRCAFFGLSATVFILPLTTYSGIIDVYELPKYTFLVASALALTTLWLIKLVFLARIGFRRNSLNLLLAAFFFICLISTLTSIRFETSLWGDGIRHFGLFTIFSLLIISFLVSQFELGKKRFHLLLLSLISSATVVAAIGVLKYAGFSLGTLLYKWQGPQAISTLGNPNFLGAFLVLSALVTLGTAFALRETTVFSKWEKVFPFFCFVSFALQLVGLYLAASRGATLGVLIGLLFFALLFRDVFFKPNKMSRVLILTILIIVLLFSLIFAAGLLRHQKLAAFLGHSVLLERMIQTFDLSTPNNAFRLLTWSTSLPMIRDHPLTGTGPDTFGLAFPRYHPENFDRYMQGEVLIPDRPHNDFLEVAPTLGLLGFLFYLSLLIAAFASGLTRFKKGKDRAEHFLIAGLLTGLAGYVTQNLFNFHVIATGLVFWLALGLTANLTASQKPKTIVFKNWLYASMPIKTALSLVLLLFALLAINKTSFTPLVAQRHITLAEGYAKAGWFEPATREAKKALESMPFSELYYLSSGWIYRQWFEAKGSPGHHYLAIEAYEKAIKTNPLERYTWMTLGAYYLKHFEKHKDLAALKNAVPVFKGLVRLEPNYSQAHYNLGVASFYLKDYPSALKEFKTTLHLKPNEKDACLLMGKIYQEQGKKQLAKKCYQKTLELDPGNEEAGQALKQLTGQ